MNSYVFVSADQPQEQTPSMSPSSQEQVPVIAYIVPSATITTANNADGGNFSHENGDTDFYIGNIGKILTGMDISPTNDDESSPTNTLERMFVPIFGLSREESCYSQNSEFGRHDLETIDICYSPKPTPDQVIPSVVNSGVIPGNRDIRSRMVDCVRYISQTNIRICDCAVSMTCCVYR